MVNVDWDPIRDALEGTLLEMTEGRLNKQLMKQCTTGYGQKYVLYVNQNNNGLYEVFMVTANARNKQVIAPIMKLSSSPMSLDSSLALLSIIEIHFSKNPLDDFTRPPVSCKIGTNYKLLTFTELDSTVHTNPDGQLLQGDEIFVRYSMNGQDFHHSGIYMGSGWVCHFVNNSIVDRPSLSAALSSVNSTLGTVKCDQWKNFVNALGPHASVPQCFRVTHPLLVREGAVIVSIAKQLMKSEIFSQYNMTFRNCQHFSSYCSYGVEFSFDSDRHLLHSDRVPSHPDPVLIPIVVNGNVPSGNLPNHLQSHYLGVPSHSVPDQSNNMESRYVATFDMPDSEYFNL